MSRIRIGGDLGDSIFSLSVVQKIPNGPHRIQFVDQEGRCTKDFTKRTHLLTALFEAQPYVESAKNSKGEADIDFTSFRNFHGATVTIPKAQAIWVGATQGVQFPEECGHTPWLTLKKKWKTQGGVVIARSDRYQNASFPWRKIVDHYGYRRITFVGLPEEHARFCHAYGPVPLQPVKNFLELAHLIAESKLFIGNQSSPMSIALGLGHPLIQEVCVHQPDCIFNRSNAQYAADGACVLPDIGGSGELKIEAPEPDVSNFSRSLIPPRGWQYPNLPDSYCFDVQKSLVKQVEGCEDAQADLMLMTHNVKRVPEFFDTRGEATLELFKTAYNLAFNPKPATACPA